MQRFGLSIALTGIVVLLALPAVAADNGFYLGGSVGQGAIDFKGDGVADLTGEDTAYKVFAGFRMLNFLAVEGSYVDFGKPDGDLGDSDGTFEANVQGFDVFAVGLLPLGIADIFVKAGVINWDAEISTLTDGNPDTESKDGSDPAYGIGLQFRIKSFAIRGEVEYFDVADSESVIMYSIGGSYTF